MSVIDASTAGYIPRQVGTMGQCTGSSLSGRQEVRTIALILVLVDHARQIQVQKHWAGPFSGAESSCFVLAQPVQQSVIHSAIQVQQHRYCSESNSVDRTSSTLPADIYRRDHLCWACGRSLRRFGFDNRARYTGSRS